MFDNFLSLNGQGPPCFPVVANNGVQSVSQCLTFNLTDPGVSSSILAPANNSSLVFPAAQTTTYQVYTKGGTTTSPLSLFLASSPAWLTFKDNLDGTGTLTGSPAYSNAGESDSIVVNWFWCCKSFTNGANTYTAKVTGPSIFASVSPQPFAYLVGSKATSITSPVLYSDESGGEILAQAPTPAGLAFYNGTCGPTLNITCAFLLGTPAVGSGGTYPIPFQITGSFGSATDNFNVVVYEKPKITSPSTVIFNLGIPSQATITTSGYPHAPIPASTGTSVMLAPESSLPTGVTFVSGTGNLNNGTGTLQYSGALSSPAVYKVGVEVSMTTGAIPFVTTGETFTDNQILNIYVGPLGDVNMDGLVTCADLTAVKAAFGTVLGQAGYSSIIDVNHDDVINIKDLAIVAQHLPAGTVCH